MSPRFEENDVVSVRGDLDPTKVNVAGTLFDEHGDVAGKLLDISQYPGVFTTEEIAIIRASMVAVLPQLRANGLSADQIESMGQAELILTARRLIREARQRKRDSAQAN